jgi:hypothetical protein
MVCNEEVDLLAEILTEAAWLRAAGVPGENVESWVRMSLEQRLPGFPLTTARKLMPRGSSASTPT